MTKHKYIFILLVVFVGILKGQALHPKSIFDADTITDLMHRVNAYARQHPWTETDRNWIRATWYTGVMGAYEVTLDPAYLDQALAWAEKHQWQPGSERAGGNVLTCGQTYLQLYFLKKNPHMIRPIVNWLDSDQPNTPSGAKVWYLEGGRRYADSLYVGPPTLAMLAQATGDSKYLDWMDAFYWDVYTELYDKEDALFYRDKRYIMQKTSLGRKTLWSRGNGWVLAGLPRILRYLPSEHPSYARFKKLYLNMSASVASRQHDDGLWRSNLGDADQYRMPESSGTAFFTYALAWGINQRFLDRETYLPVVMKAWQGLTRCIHKDGKLGWVQPVDGKPRPALPETTHEYAVGLFLLAGSEVLKLAQSGAIDASLAKSIQVADQSLLPPVALITKPLSAGSHPLADRIIRFQENQQALKGLAKTELTKKDYLDVIAGQVKAMVAYQNSEGRIIDPVSKREMYYATPCFAHSVALLAQAKYPLRPELIESGMQALDVSIETIAKNQVPGNHGDFYTWPLVFAYELFADSAKQERKKAWRAGLVQMDPASCYAAYRTPLKRYGNTRKDHRDFYELYHKPFAHNWNLVNAAGEFARSLNGLTDLYYVDYCLAMQLANFTPYGMYSENGNPLPYDLFARHYVTGMLFRGYRSFAFTSYRDILWKGAWTSLFMQSPTGEAPTGYRSSHHIWNEAEQAVIFEVYATAYARAGRKQEAGAFKRAAHLALKSIKNWIRADGSGFVVKNRYPKEAKHGYESYTEHTCYNLLACSMLAQAYQFATESIEEKPCPADVGGFAFTVPGFHKVFANAGGTYIEYDTDGDQIYNPTGLLRIHLAAGHPQLGPSDGCAKDAGAYYKNPAASYSVGPAWQDAAGNWMRLAELKGLNPEVSILTETPEYTQVSITYQIGNSNTDSPVTLREVLSVKPNEVYGEVTVEGLDVETLRIYYPMLVFDGQEYTDISMDRTSLSMTLRGKGTQFEALHSLETELVRTGQKLKHRNGIMEPIYFDMDKPWARYRITVPD